LCLMTTSQIGMTLLLEILVYSYNSIYSFGQSLMGQDVVDIGVVDMAIIVAN
jgi:hypothetical protein